MKVVEPSTVAVTRTVFAPPPSATEVWVSTVSVSASTDKVIAVGATSSSVIVPVAVAVVDSFALVGADSWTANVSSGSSIASSRVATVTVSDVDPAAMVISVAAREV